jgi:hypothetical protein
VITGHRIGVLNFGTINHQKGLFLERGNKKRENYLGRAVDGATPALSLSLSLSLPAL